MRWAFGILLYAAVASILIAGGYQAGVRDTTTAVRAWALDEGLAELHETDDGGSRLVWRVPTEQPKPLPVYMRARK